jgi:hypothetical protein
MLSGGVLFGMLGQASTSFIGIGARAIDGLASSEASQAVRRQPDGVQGAASVSCPPATCADRGGRRWASRHMPR